MRWIFYAALVMCVLQHATAAEGGDGARTTPFLVDTLSTTTPHRVLRTHPKQINLLSETISVGEENVNFHQSGKFTQKTLSKPRTSGLHNNFLQLLGKSENYGGLETMEGNEDEMQWMVHVKTPVTPLLKRRVNGCLGGGHKLGKYVPHGTFMLVAPQNVAERVARECPEVIDVLHFDQKHKLSPQLLHEVEPPNIHLMEIDEDNSNDLLSGILIQLSHHHTRSRNSTSELVVKWRSELQKAGFHNLKVDCVSPYRISIHLSEQMLDNKPHTRQSQWREQQQLVHWLSNQHEVNWIQQKPSWRLLNHYSHGISQALDREEDSTPIWDHGIRGEGQVVAVGDTGIDHDMCFFKDPHHDIPVNTAETDHRKFAMYHTFNTDRSNRREPDTSDESNGHGTHTGCSIAGDCLDYTSNSNGTSLPNLGEFNGMAPKAKLAIYDFGSSVGLNIPDDLFNDYFQYAHDETIARILSNSWGDISGEYDAMAEDVDQFMHDYPDFLIMFACGNSGDQGLFTLVTPAVAKNVLAIGAQTSFPQGSTASPKGSGTEGYVSYFSSRGPTNDGRIKPDVIANGEYIKSAKSNGKITSDQCNDLNANACLITKKGTSMSCPVAAGNMALVRQYFVDGFYPGGKAEPRNKITPSSALLKATVISSGIPVVGVVNTPSAGRYSQINVDRDPMAPPNIEQGYGRMTLEMALAFDDSPYTIFVIDTEYNNKENGLETLDSKHLCLFVDDISEDVPFKVTIVWTEPKSSSASSINLINDLDLIVTNIDESEIFLGNHHFREAGHPEADILNNVEQVWLTTEDSGLFSIHIIGANVPEGPQNYALFVSGDFEMLDLDDCKGQAICPNDCSGQGDCIDGVCDCYPEYFDADCSVEAAAFPVSEGAVFIDDLISGQWIYYRLEVQFFDGQPTDDLTVTMQRTSADGDPDIYIAYDRYPSLRDYDFLNVDCDSCSRSQGGVSRSQITIPHDELQEGVYRVGVFAYCCDDVSFSLGISDFCFLINGEVRGACIIPPTPEITSHPTRSPTALLTAQPTVIPTERATQSATGMSTSETTENDVVEEVEEEGQEMGGGGGAGGAEEPEGSPEVKPSETKSPKGSTSGKTCTEGDDCDDGEDGLIISTEMIAIIAVSGIGLLVLIGVAIYLLRRACRSGRATDSKSARPSTSGLFNKTTRHRKLDARTPQADSPFDTVTELQTAQLNAAFSITDNSDDEADTDDESMLFPAGINAQLPPQQQHQQNDHSTSQPPTSAPVSLESVVSNNSQKDSLKGSSGETLEIVADDGSAGEAVSELETNIPRTENEKLADDNLGENNGVIENDEASEIHANGGRVVKPNESSHLLENVRRDNSLIDNEVAVHNSDDVGDV